MFGNLDLVEIALRIPVLLLAITVHEYAHARMAYHFGDDTARLMGRMNLNPLSHLDPIGTLMILLAGFGWAKPVPINPLRFRNYRSGMLWVSFAGPLANFIFGFISLVLLAILVRLGVQSTLLIRFLGTLVQLNILLGVFNLVPVPPLDGSKILAALAPGSLLSLYRQIEPYAPLILILLIATGLLGRIIFPVYALILTLFNAIVGLLPGL